MKFNVTNWRFFVSLALLAATPVATSAQEIMSFTSDDSAGLTAGVDEYRNALGTLNANEPVNGDPSGRRQINWDAAPDSISDPNAFPGDFFNFNAAPRARGIEFQTAGSTTGFQLSATVASGEPPFFGSNEFTAFSPERLFTPVNGETFNVFFFDPANNNSPAVSRGLGVVFSGVDVADLTEMIFYDSADEVLLTQTVEPSSEGGFSFLGVIYDEAIVARVQITLGGTFNGDNFSGTDPVVMDDFIFGEPIAEQQVFSFTAADAAGLAPGVDVFRDALGVLNANEPVNGDPNGRRQINWDAAPDSISDPNAFPGDFFNFNGAPRARGIEFQQVGNTTGFQLSSTQASGEPVTFGSDEFNAFSPERLFTPVDGDTFDVLFFDPANNDTPTTTRGLGVVFNGVDQAGLTTMSFFSADDELLFTESVEPSPNGGFSFLGAIFNDPIVARVQITLGGTFDGENFQGTDPVVMDDFIFGEPVKALVQEIFDFTADDAAGLTADVDAFRDALGVLNANDPVNGDPNGRRQINWDAAPDAISDPNLFPGDFFNFNATPRARGIEFQPVGTTSAFQLSSTAASGEPINFGSDGFAPFSPERLFTPLNGDTFDVKFFDPANNDNPALSRGLGVVFNDVEEAGLTTMSFFSASGGLLYEESVDTSSNAGFSFLGTFFDEPVVARVRIQIGGIFDGENFSGADSVVMDDFIFGEPIPVLLGDINGDGSLNLLDVAPFIDVIVWGAFEVSADINQDGAVNLLDVEPFIELLTGG